MLGHITGDQYEQMRQQLIVPLAISNILGHDLHVEADMQYGLHMALSEIDPDSALMAIALCAQDLAAKVINRAPIAIALQKEATDILNEYAPSWMRNNLNAPIPSHVYEDILETVPEDLEGLADLLDALGADLNETDSACATLASLLSIQARAHMEIADFVLAEIAYEKQEDHVKKAQTPDFSYQSVTPKTESNSFAGDNVIVFPRARE